MNATPEMRFLAQCLPGSHAALDASDLVSMDWDSLVDLAGWHGMFPLLASKLLAFDRAADAPAAVLSRLRAIQSGCIGRSITQLAALVELQREFDQAGIKIVAWKGPSAGLLLYGSATLRESADLDFLFLEEDLHALFEITNRLGYDLLGKSESESKDIYILTRQREFTFGRKADQVVLEFHLQIMPSRFALWQDSPGDIHRANTTIELGDVTLLLQKPEDLLVSLCAHATKHNWDRLKWSADIAQFLKVYSEDLDWPQLLDELNTTGKDLVVLLGLALAETIYGLTLPTAVRKALHEHPRIVALANETTARVMAGEKESTHTRQRKALADLLCPRLRDRFSYTVTPIVELNYEDLYVPVHNRLLFFMNYGFRVVRLLRKYGPQRLATKTAGSVRSVH